MELASDSAISFGRARRLILQLILFTLISSTVSAISPQLASAATEGSGNCVQTYSISTGSGSVSVTESSGYCYVAFKNSGASNTQTTFSWTRPSWLTSLDNVLIVAGGGGSYGVRGPGAGAGGFRCLSNVPVSVTSYPIIVGAGGATDCAPGNVSSALENSSTGGGRSNSIPGGSGSGGFASASVGGLGNAGGYTPPEGNPGGNALIAAPFYGGGGGGGASQAGSPSSPTGGGAGGDGAVSTITGSPVIYAGGGGGSVNVCTGGALGGAGGGGNAARSPALPGTNTGGSGTINTGGGAGGGAGPSGTGASGGSGIVIIRYKFQ